MDKIKVTVEKAIRQGIINAFIQGHINEQQLHNIIKMNNIKLHN